MDFGWITMTFCGGLDALAAGPNSVGLTGRTSGDGCSAETPIVKTGIGDLSGDLRCPTTIGLFFTSTEGVGEGGGLFFSANLRFKSSNGDFVTSTAGGGGAGGMFFSAKRRFNAARGLASSVWGRGGTGGLNDASFAGCDGAGLEFATGATGGD